MNAFEIRREIGSEIWNFKRIRTGLYRMHVDFNISCIFAAWPWAMQKHNGKTAEIRYMATYFITPPHRWSRRFFKIQQMNFLTLIAISLPHVGYQLQTTISTCCVQQPTCHRYPASRLIYLTHTPSCPPQYGSAAILICRWQSTRV